MSQNAVEGLPALSGITSSRSADRGTTGGEASVTKSGEKTESSISDSKDVMQEQLTKAWKLGKQELARLSVEIQRRSKKPRRFWMKKGIAEMVEAQRDTFDFLSQQMSDDELLHIRIEYRDCSTRINDFERKLADIHASIAMNSEKPGGPYHRLATHTKAELEAQDKLRSSKIEKTMSRLEAYRVSLSQQQAEVLLSRIDAEDIIRMTTVFAVISRMTEQFAGTKLQSGENLDVTKKYYGMYIALLELQLFIQNEYIVRLDGQYIPGVREIQQDAENLRDETKRKIKGSDEKHRHLYEKNLKSQAFTSEVTSIYCDALVQDADKVSRAKGLVQKHHDVAENTLKTVQISADLSSLVSQNESLYHEVMALQVPDLIPFENLQMQREFEAVTARLQAE